MINTPQTRRWRSGEGMIICLERQSSALRDGDPGREFDMGAGLFGCADVRGRPLASLQGGVHSCGGIRRVSAVTPAHTKREAFLRARVHPDNKEISKKFKLARLEFSASVLQSEARALATLCNARLKDAVFLRHDWMKDARGRYDRLVC
jgi:hypothetical protein